MAIPNQMPGVPHIFARSIAKGILNRRSENPVINIGERVSPAPLNDLPMTKERAIKTSVKESILRN